MTEQIRKTMERDGTDGNSHRARGNGREQAGMSRESWRTMEKVRENTVHDKLMQRRLVIKVFLHGNAGYPYVNKI